MKLLHIDASILGANSVTRPVAAAVVDRLRQATPDLTVTYRDLTAEPLPHLALPALPLPALPGDEAVLDEFLAADIVVVGAPMYNFTIPSQLKAWIDRIVVRGKTFSYSEKGPEGLEGAKRVIIVVARGGLYGPGMPHEAAEHLVAYLRTVFGFIGITNPEIIVAEGIGVSPEHRDRAITGAMQAASALGAG
jgi:FMN-dependent NADH-azoreductase